MSDLLHRFRYPLTYFLLAAVCAVSMAAKRGPSELSFAPRLVLALTLPLEQMVTLPVRELRGLWSDYVALVGVRDENQRLRQRVERLQEENLQYREAIVASERFQKLQRGSQQAREVPMIPANVVHQDLSSWFQSLVIDQGTAAGIRPGMAVITDSGVVGLVSGTTPSAAKVLLVIDPQSRVDSFVERTRARGTVRGSGERDCALDHVVRQEDLKEGDRLLTSGIGAMYPKGLVVGTVQSVDRSSSGLFLAAKISPAVDFNRLEEVFVVLEQRDVPDDEAFVAEDEGLWPTVPPQTAGPNPEVRTHTVAEPPPAPRPARPRPPTAIPVPEPSAPPAPVVPQAIAPPPAPIEAEE